VGHNPYALLACTQLYAMAHNSQPQNIQMHVRVSCIFVDSRLASVDSVMSAVSSAMDGSAASGVAYSSLRSGEEDDDLAEVSSLDETPGALSGPTPLASADTDDDALAMDVEVEPVE